MVCKYPYFAFYVTDSQTRYEILGMKLSFLVLVTLLCFLVGPIFANKTADANLML